MGRISKRDTLVKAKADEFKIELTANERVQQLIMDNTSRVQKRAANSTYKCLALIASGASQATACRLTGVTPTSVSLWKRKDWYHEAIELIREELDTQLDGNLTKAINKGLSKVHERLETGDPIVNSKTGDVVGYKPVSARDSAIVASIFFDKRNLLRNKPTTIVNNQSTESRLNMLKEKFKEMAIVEGEYEIIEPLEEVKEDYGKRIETQTIEQVCDSEGSGREVGEDLRIKEEEYTDEGEKSEGCFTFATA